MAALGSKGVGCADAEIGIVSQNPAISQWIVFNGEFMGVPLFQCKIVGCRTTGQRWVAKMAGNIEYLRF